MDFFSKKIGRMGKTAENFMVYFRPIELKVNVYESDSEFVLVFKRGPQKDPTKRYKAEPPKYGGHMQSVVFEGEEFQRISGFYKEKEGVYQAKKAKV